MKRAVIRLPPEIIDRLDRLADALRAARPDESFSRASVARALISSGLSLAEALGEDQAHAFAPRPSGSGGLGRA